MPKTLSEDERERIQIATAALRAIAGNVPVILTEYGLAVLPDTVLLESPLTAWCLPGGRLLLRDDGRSVRVTNG
jgi:hypothetical protein